jgi:hypothetical protein
VESLSNYELLDRNRRLENGKFLFIVKKREHADL